MHELHDQEVKRVMGCLPKNENIIIEDNPIHNYCFFASPLDFIKTTRPVFKDLDKEEYFKLKKK